MILSHQQFLQKIFILDVSLGFKYSSDFCDKYLWKKFQKTPNGNSSP